MSKNKLQNDEANIRFGLDVLTNFNQAPTFTAQSLGDSEQDLEIAKSCSELKDNSRKWSMAQTTQGLGLGEKISECRPTGDLCLKVYVDKKLPNSKVKNPIPKYIDVPGSGRLITDIEEIGKIEMEAMTTRTRPIMPGCGLGHTDVNAGTLGCLVTKKSDPSKVYILSNSHVLAASGQANLGDRIIQPAKYDKGQVSTDTIANLAEFEPFDYSSGYPNLIDAAIAEIASDIQMVPDIRSLGYAPIGVSHALKRGMNIQKVGRTSDLTTGIIRDIDFRTRFPYKLKNNTRKTVGFSDVVLCSRFTSPGDSGSAVLNMRKRIVGLHFAGSVSGSIFCKISNVFKILELKLAR